MENRILHFILTGFLLLGLVDLQAAPLSEGVDFSNESIQITGVVKDNSGEPLIGVSIKNEANNTGTVTDMDGNFALSVKKGDVLSFTYIGYLTKKITIANQTSLNIVMSEDAQKLDEIVVIGYGTTKKSDLTGTVESIKADKLTQGNATNAIQMLQGRVAGLYINSHNQDPGSTNTTLLRGVGSLSGNSEPLVVVDGLPLSDMGILNTISPNNIEQIDVLKDASATAIYGSRGANGVIIITTKSGNAGNVTVDYGAKLSIEKVGRTVDMMNSEEYIRFYYDLAHDKDFSYGYPEGYEGNFYPYPLEAIGTVADTDWQKELTKTTSLSQEHNLSVSGGNDVLKYRVSGSYYDGSSIVGPYDYKRFNVDSKLSYRKGKVAFMVNLAYTKENTDKNKNSYQNAIHFAPTCGKFDETGALSKFPVASVSWYENPFLNEWDTENFSEANTTRLGGNISYELLPGFKVEGRAGFERRFYEEYFYQEKRYTRDKGSIAHSNNMNMNFDLLLTYAKTFGKNNINAMGGINYQSFRNRGNDMSGEGFSSPQIKYYQMNNILEKNNREISSFWNEKALSSYLARVNYSYDDRYLITANFRIDGATQFAPKNKWGYFPSIAAAWRIDREKFYHCDFFNNMKLKLGYGLAGNANIPTGRSQALLAYVPVYTGGITENGVTWNGGYFPNSDLKWEGSRTANLGFELGSQYFWMEVNGYYKKSFDLLMDRSKPVETGYSKITLNKGELVNYGVEARIDGYFNFLSNDLRWTPSITVSYNHNEITKFDNDMVWTAEVWGTGKRNALMGYAGCNREGYPVGALFGYQYLGVWQENEREAAANYGAKPGEPKFLDHATSDGSGKKTADGGDGKIDDADRIYLGSSYPGIMGTLNNTITYKDWSLSFMFDGVFKKKAVNYNRLALIDPTPVEYGNLSREALNRWTPDFPNTDIPSLTSPVDSKLAISTFCIEDASFVRLREVTLSWQHNFAPTFFLKKLRVYLTGNNLATITKYKGLNPDIWGVDNSWNLAPITRSYVMGINLTF